MSDFIFNIWLFMAGQAKFLIVAFLLALGPTMFWLGFYLRYSQKFTTPRRYLLFIFGCGLVIAFFVGLVEVNFISSLPLKLFFLFSQNAPTSHLTLTDILFVFGLMFFFIAPLEEGIKYLVLKRVIYRTKTVDQIIDGIKFGIMIGLGFATIENAYYFWQYLPIENYGSFIFFFLLRLLIATLAHSLYGGIAGYYLALAKFHKIYEKEFLIKGIVTLILMHGIFNFAFFLQQTLFAVSLIIVTLIIVMKWYQDRVHFQYNIAQRLGNSLPPFLAEKHEIEDILYSNRITYAILKTLKFCPFCLKRRKTPEDYCHYCGQKFV